MKTTLGRYASIRVLRRQIGYSSEQIRNIDTGEELVLKTVSRKHFELNRADLARHFSWLQTQSHPGLCPVLTAGIGLRGELYWTRSYLSRCDTEIAAASDFRNIVGAIAYLHSYGFVHRRIRPSNVL